jgi:TatD DNase family protein
MGGNQMIFDTHSHYDDEVFDTDRKELLSGLADKGIGYVVNVGANIKGSKDSLALAETYDFIYASLGVHPSETGELTEADIDWMRENSAHEKVVAIGEIGLDYHWPEPSPEIQKKWFIRQIELAKTVSLPIIVHSRDAAADTMEIIKAEKAYECGGVIHCFSYSPEMAKEYVEMGFYIGIGGVVTFKNAKKCVRTVEQIPIEHIILETDCPYMAPEPNRGTRNDSSNLTYVAKKIAELKGITEEEVIRITTENAEKMYRMA